MKPRFFHDLRISENFVMTDFLQSPSLYNARIPFRVADLPKSMGGAVALCNLLEEMMLTFGPCSLAAGFVPNAALGRGHPPDSPHGWTPDKAAADVVFHDWVNKHKSPIALVGALPDDTQFHRMITYAGSEFICVTAERLAVTTDPLGGYHRHAVIEGVRKPGGGSQRVRWCDGHFNWNRVRRDLRDRADWRRHEHEVPGNSPELRTHHVRVGEYFTLLDFCRSPYAYESGKPWVIPPGHEPQTTYARMAAEVLSPVVKAHGRVSVIRGLMPRALADREEDPTLWLWREGVAAVEFMPGENIRPAAVVDSLTHKSIEQVTAYELIGGTSYRVEFKPFKPRKIWSSAVQPVARTPRRNLDLT